MVTSRYRGNMMTYVIRIKVVDYRHSPSTDEKEVAAVQLKCIVKFNTTVFCR